MGSRGVDLAREFTMRAPVQQHLPLAADLALMCATRCKCAARPQALPSTSACGVSAWQRLRRAPQKSPKSHTHLAMVCAQPGCGATGCGDARSSGAHPPLRTAAACTRSERRRMPRPRKPARPLSACRRDHRGLVGWQWWAARCCAAGDSAAARRVASAANHTPGRAAEDSGPPAARHEPMTHLLRGRFSRFAKLPNSVF